MACIIRDFVYTTLSMIWYTGLFFRSYELVQCYGSLECYTYVCVFKQIGNFSYFGAMVSECDPDIVVFLFGFFL
jgi:hypothetical protein